jgi:hypothetical protein
MDLSHEMTEKLATGRDETGEGWLIMLPRLAG